MVGSKVTAILMTIRAFYILDFFKIVSLPFINIKIKLINYKKISYGKVVK